MKILFYALYGMFGLLGVWFVAGSIVGHYVVAPLPQGVSKLVLLAGTAAGGYLLYRAYLTGEVEGRYGAGTGLVVLAVVLFQAIQVAGMLVGGAIQKLGGGGGV